MQIGSRIRRSDRIARELPIILRWQPAGRDVEDDPARTVLLSKHGCSLRCRVPLKVGGQVYVLDPARGKSARARVVYREFSAPGQESQVAVEFLGADSFWAEFPSRPHPASQVAQSAS